MGDRDREPVQDRLSKPPVAIATGGLSYWAVDLWRATCWGLMGFEQNVFEQSAHAESAHEQTVNGANNGAEMLRAIEPARYPRGENYQEL